MIEYLKVLVASALKVGDVMGEEAITFEKPRSAEHGDLTTNVAMVLAKRTGKNPRQLAQSIIDDLAIDRTMLDRVEVAGPGFINFYFTPQFFQDQLLEILKQGKNYGRYDGGKRKRTQVEFVSANPTGPLTVGHGRGAVFGDTVARLLEWANYDVTREYYFNNAGRQMRVLGDSVRMRYLEMLGNRIDYPEDYYQGEYIKDVAQLLKLKYGTSLKEESAEGLFKRDAEQAIFEGIKQTLKRLGIAFDVFYNENSLYESGHVNEVIQELRNRKLAYEHEGALWFKATSYGGEADKVIVKSTGEPTYRLPDIAYHREKIKRGFELIIDVLGADHIATYPDVLAGLKALGYDTANIKVLIHQFVTIIQDGEVVKMSTRKANFITLDELIDEVGVDVVRYFFLMRSIDSHLNFDLKLAKEQSEENPVYYLQYAHARIASIIRYAESQGVFPEVLPDVRKLIQSEEIGLLKLLSRFRDEVESCVKSFEPHRLAEYLHNVAGSFHQFYHVQRVVTEDQSLTLARIGLCLATKTILANGFSILGITAPEKM